MQWNRDEILQVMATILEVESDELSQIGDDDDLTSHGFTSVSIIKFIVMLEDKYNFSLDDDDLNLEENFNTLTNIQAVLSKY